MVNDVESSWLAIVGGEQAEIVWKHHSTNDTQHTEEVNKK